MTTHYNRLIRGAQKPESKEFMYPYRAMTREEALEIINRWNRLTVEDAIHFGEEGPQYVYWID